MKTKNKTPLNSCKNTPYIQLQVEKPITLMDKLDVRITARFSTVVSGNAYRSRNSMSETIANHFYDPYIYFRNTGYISIGSKHASLNGTKSTRESLDDPIFNQPYTESHKNQFTDSEKVRLMELSNDVCTDQIGILIDQISNARTELTSLTSVREITLQPTKLREAQFCREYPITTSRIEEVMQLFTSSIAHNLGYYDRTVQYSKRWTKEGLLAEWRIQVKGKRNRHEKATLKIYIKNSLLRVEVAFRNPTLLSAKVADQVSVLKKRLINLKNKAEVILDIVHKDLKLPKLLVSPEDLYMCLRKYNFNSPKNSLSLIEFCRQICETGIYDSAAAKKMGLGLNDYQLQKLSHPDFGMLEKKPAIAVGGKNKSKYIRVLRDDFRERASAFQRFRYGSSKPVNNENLKKKV